ncbi:uncharacterized protein LOC120842156 [Ixodes scapularis]|uniref:uncharacterized protein LOC120842156 n=1 Tax=Ixodes scapularis TaxID=6945 RepID=UPI001A9E2FF4|nr:uncharacterized protein LOC120842156 [Ixodes scapularis]
MNDDDDVDCFNYCGNIPEFCVDSGGIDVYLEWSNLYAAATDLAKGKKLLVLFTVLGKKAYVTLRTLLLPKTPTEAGYDKAVAVLRKHYAPKRSVVTERYRFYRRDQGPAERISDFVVALNTLAATFAFGILLEEALRDHLVAGLRNEAVCSRLLAMDDKGAPWESVFNVAKAVQAGNKDTKEILAASTLSTADVNWQRRFDKPSKQGCTKQQNSGRRINHKGAWENNRQKIACTNCYRWRDSHLPETWPFLNSTCFKRSKTGHVAKMLKTKAVHDFSCKKVKT